MVVASSIHCLANSRVAGHHCIDLVTIDFLGDAPIRLGTQMGVHYYYLQRFSPLEERAEHQVVCPHDELLAWKEVGLFHMQARIQHDPVSLKDLLVVHT